MVLTRCESKDTRGVHLKDELDVLYKRSRQTLVFLTNFVRLSVTVAITVKKKLFQAQTYQNLQNMS